MKISTNQSKRPRIAIPIKSGGKWRCGEINKDGTVNQITGIADHHTEQSCWICCDAHNQRVGYSKKKVKKMLKKWAKKEKNTKQRSSSK